MENMGMIDELRKNYAGKKVLLTGHTGFKGSWMLVLLNTLGADVYGYALAPEGPDALYCAIDGDGLCRSQIADIRDKDTLIRSAEDIRPDFIFHLAAQAIVRESYRIPVETFDTNIMGTVHMLEALRKLQQDCIAVMITTDKVYENMEWEFHYKETDRLGGFDPYSSSKAAAEIAIASYQKAFFDLRERPEYRKAVAAARGGNVIGGGDRAEYRIIPDLVRALSKGEKLEIRNPYAIRPWQHVLELLYGYLLLAVRLKNTPEKMQGAWNFGPEADDEMTVEELVKCAIGIWGSGSYTYVPDKEKLHEAGILRLSIDKAKRMLDWHPRWNSGKAIEKTMDWYRATADGKNARHMCIDQIKDYFSENAESKG